MMPLVIKGEIKTAWVVIGGLSGSMILTEFVV
jgi:hypothetical protein